MRNKIILTFDLEFWHDDDLINDYMPENKKDLPDNVLESVLPLLELLGRYGVTSTFFILGQVAEKYPGLIKEIQEAGHEIACHGYVHRKLGSLSKEEFNKGIERSVDSLRQITGKNPLGFRAPYFSLNNNTKWALEIIEKHGFVYDSSIFPFKTFLRGDLRTPLGVYRISPKDISLIDSSSNLAEFPLSVYEKYKIRIPMAGGFYFRVTPFFIYRRLLESVLKKRPAVIYIHPSELYNFVPKISMPLIRNKIKFWGVEKSFEKFEKLLRTNGFEFTSAEDFLKKNHAEI